MMKTAKFTTLALAAMMLAGCAASADAATRTPAALTGGTPASEIRIGYFANVTHAPALVGLQEGIFDKDITAKVSAELFNAGPATIEALSAGAIDAAFIGPNPSINSYIQSAGRSVRIVAGATTGGAALVVKSGITKPEDLKGKTLATPQLGNTQDVALRNWLAGRGFKTDTTGGCDVKITPTDNAQTLALFRQGKIDGAWLPEPWVSRLVEEAGATVLVDEADLWKNGAFPTTVLLVNADFLAKHPQTVKQLVQGDVDAIAWLNENKSTAANAINEKLKADSGKGLSDAVLRRSLEHVTFSADPQAQTYTQLVQHGLRAGTQKRGSVDGLFDLRLLNEVLKADGDKTVSAHGLGEQ